MKSRFFDESLNNVVAACRKILTHLNFEFDCHVSDDSVIINAERSDCDVIFTIKQSRKGIIKVTTEVEKQVRSILDYEFKKKLEISLLNSIEVFLQPAEEVELGI